MYRRPVAGVYMKNFIRRLLGRFYAVNHSDVLSYKGSWRKGFFHGYGILGFVIRRRYKLALPASSKFTLTKPY